MREIRSKNKPREGHGRFIPEGQAQGTARGLAVAGARDGLRAKAWSGIEYKGRGNLCDGNNFKCGAQRALDTTHCVGHLRSLGLLDEARAAKAAA